MDVLTYQIEVTADIAAKIRVLAELGFFALKGGSCEIHIDAEGAIQQLITHTHHRVKTYPHADLLHMKNERIMKE